MWTLCRRAHSKGSCVNYVTRSFWVDDPPPPPNTWYPPPSVPHSRPKCYTMLGLIHKLRHVWQGCGKLWRKKHTAWRGRDAEKGCVNREPTKRDVRLLSWYRCNAACVNNVLDRRDLRLLIYLKCRRFCIAFITWKFFWHHIHLIHSSHVGIIYFCDSLSQNTWPPCCNALSQYSQKLRRAYGEILQS